MAVTPHEEAQRRWRDDLRKTGRYVFANIERTRICLDCGAYVHIELLWLHNEHHTRSDASREHSPAEAYGNDSKHEGGSDA